MTPATIKAMKATAAQENAAMRAFWGETERHSGNPGKPPKIDRARLPVLWAQGVPLQEIAAMYGVNKNSVSTAASRMGLPPRGRVS